MRRIEMPDRSDTVCLPKRRPCIEVKGMETALSLEETGPMAFHSSMVQISA